MKLGRGKPVTEPVRYRTLSPDEHKRTKLLREDLLRHDPPTPPQAEGPFAFLTRWKRPSSGYVRRQHDPQAPLRLAYSYFSSCGDALLDPTHDPYPDAVSYTHRCV